METITVLLVTAGVFAFIQTAQAGPHEDLVQRAGGNANGEISVNDFAAYLLSTGYDPLGRGLNMVRSEVKHMAGDKKSLDVTVIKAYLQNFPKGKLSKHITGLL